MTLHDPYIQAINYKFLWDQVNSNSFMKLRLTTILILVHAPCGLEDIIVWALFFFFV